MLLFCNVSVNKSHPSNQSIQERAIRQLEDLAKVIESSEDEVYFWQPEESGKEHGTAAPKFNGFANFLRALKDGALTSGHGQVDFPFYLSIPLLQGLEAIGISLDSGKAEISMPLQCSPPGMATLSYFD